MNSHPKLRLVQDFICEILKDWPNVVELVSNPFVNLLIDNFINVIVNVKIVQKDEMNKWNERKNIKSGEKIIQ